MALILKNSVNPYPAVLTVSNTLLFNQMVDFFNKVFYGEFKVGEVKSGKCEPSKFLTVCMIKTLKNNIEKSVNVQMWAASCKTLIVDEADESGAKEYSEVLSKIGAGMRINMSGTALDSNKVNNMVAIGLSGPVLGNITNKELIEKGVSQMPTVNVLWNNVPIRPVSSYPKEEYENIHSCENRVKLICEEIIAKNLGKQILITFKDVEHGNYMYDYICSRFPDVCIDVLSGESENRQTRLDRFKRKETTVLICSMIIKRGLNIPTIEVMVMGQGGKSITTVKQLSGRGIRHDGVNQEVAFYDFYDNGKYIAAHSRKRISIYSKEGFKLVKHYKDKRNQPVDY
jgi:superfamily II DNA or RNA helicase